MMHEVAAADGTGWGAGGDTVTVGKVEGDAGEGWVDSRCQGGTDVAAVVSGRQQQQQQQLWLPSWECC